MHILTLQRSDHVPTFSHRNGEQLPDLRRGLKPRVQDVDMLTWMDAQEEASLSPFKGDHITEFLKRMGDSYAGSGETCPQAMVGVPPRFKKVSLSPDGSRTHLTVANLKQAKELGVETVVFPPHMTYVIQPLDR